MEEKVEEALNLIQESIKLLLEFHDSNSIDDMRNMLLEEQISDLEFIRDNIDRLLIP